MSAKVVTAGEIHKAVLNGDIKTVKSLISEDPIRINSLDTFKYNPLENVFSMQAPVAVEPDTYDEIYPIGTDIS